MTSPARSDLDPEDAELIARAYEEILRVARSKTGPESELAAILKDARDPGVLGFSVHENWPGTLLDWAIREGSVDCARVLIEAGARPAAVGEGVNDGADSITLLNMAMYAHSHEDKLPAFIQLLKVAGLDFHAETGPGDWTSLHNAVRYGSATYARLLIEDGAPVSQKFAAADLEGEILRDVSDEERPRALEALRFVRSVALERSILLAMQGEGGDAKPSAEMPL